MSKPQRSRISQLPPRQASRMAHIQPFFVMEILDKATALENAGHSVIHLEVGEPDFDTPAPVVAAGVQALRDGHTRYVEALGLPRLRERIADSYPDAVRPDPARIAVSPGSSGALQMICAAVVEPGDRVLMADPGYPCNANFVRLCGGEPVLVPAGPDTHYQLTSKSVRDNWTDNTAAVMLGTPSNPTGTVIAPGEMTRIVETVQSLGGVAIVDEIYHGLTYGSEVRTALHDSDQVFVVNSFSKYFGMTGWRVGWLVMPESYRPAISKLAQSLFISTSVPAQYAALRALDDDVIEELEARRELFRQRRDFLVPALRELGFSVPLMPEGAFYVYADSSAFGDDSGRFAHRVLDHTKVGITPGRDFGRYRATDHVRFSYANTLDNLEQAVERLTQFLGP